MSAGCLVLVSTLRVGTVALWSSTTKAVLPSGVIATQSALAPARMSAGSLLCVFTSIVDTVPLTLLTTKAVLPFGVTATLSGNGATAMSVGFLVLVFTSIVDTVPLVTLVTKAVLPSGVMPTPNGAAPTGMSVGFLRLVFTSIVDTESAALLVRRRWSGTPCVLALPIPRPGPRPPPRAPQLHEPTGIASSLPRLAACGATNGIVRRAASALDRRRVDGAVLVGSFETAVERPHRLAERVGHVPHRRDDIVDSVVADPVPVDHQPLSDCPVHGVADQRVLRHARPLPDLMGRFLFPAVPLGIAWEASLCGRFPVCPSGGVIRLAAEQLIAELGGEARHPQAASPGQFERPPALSPEGAGLGSNTIRGSSS